MINILAIESSCDETACSVVTNGREVKSNIISSQIDIHKLYGGVVPEIAARNHIKMIDFVVAEALDKANMTFEDINAIAVTSGPGLIGALLVGVSYAKGLAYSLDIPLVPVHHIEGHIAANYIDHKELQPEFLCLVISGGHSHIIHVKDYNSFEIVAKTRDDACGEAFDKVARVLGLGYPGGPKIEELARDGDENAIKFTIPKVSDSNYDYSFSGLKSSVLNYINKCEMTNTLYNKADIAASFQNVAATMLIDNLILVAKDKGIEKIAVAGGVSANNYICNRLKNECEKNNYKFYRPSKILCTDNAAMIGASAYFNYINREKAELDLNAVAHIDVGNHNFI